jgi:hypothetical protein
MADIFLSYAKEDRAAARRVSDALEALGWSVWWDREIPAGQTWRDVLENALSSMRCMVVLWSRNSIKSEWVKEEAEEGHTQRKLVPVLIEDVRPPMGFRAIQAADLIDWDNSIEFAGFKRLIEALESHLGKPANPATAVTGKKTVSAQTLRDESEAATWQPTGKSGTTIQTTRLQQWLEKLPWWTYAATTVLITMIVASVLLSQRATTSVKGPSVTLPVNPLDAGELGPTKNAPPTIAVPQGVRPVETSPTMPIYNPSEMPVEKKPAKRTDAARTNSIPIPSGPTNSDRCAEVLARAQLGEPLSNADRDALKKECR